MDESRLNEGEGEHLSEIEKSINYWNGESFEKYKTWLEKRIKLNDNTSIFLYEHIENFLSIYNSKLGMNSFIFKEKLLMLSLELKRLEKAKKISTELVTQFGNQEKVFLLITGLSEIDPKSNPERSLSRYKSLMLNNQNDKNSIKRYIMSMKFITTLDNIGTYISYWNSYLKNYMDDQDAWNELGETYLDCNNLNKASYCFEELLLHNPYNYRNLNRLGDIQCSFNTLDGCKTAIKFYSRSLEIFVNNRAMWGICSCLDFILDKEKKLDTQMKQLGKLMKVFQKNLYANSPFKFELEEFFHFPKLIKEK